MSHQPRSEDLALLPPAPAPSASETVLELGRACSVGEMEQLLPRLAPGEGGQRQVRLKVASSSDGGVLADVWTAILVGTACRSFPTDVTAWGLQRPIKRKTPFALSPAFLAALSTARSIGSESGEQVPAAEARRVLSLVNKGLVDWDSGSVQTLVEFDPDYPVAPVLRGGDGFEPVSPLVRKRLFEQQVLKFRRRLEIGALRRGAGTAGLGAAGDVGRFLAELHENGVEHGSRDAHGRATQGTRFLRLKKHIAGSRDELVARCGGIPALAQHLERCDIGVSAMVEASISDFGPGIVDGFLRSPAADGIKLSRRDLLDNLVHERLSSKSRDPSAGLGIQKALQSADRMQAFVSLRTAEFWLVASYASDTRDVRLTDVGGGPHPSVTGTHWQILWPQP